MYLFRCLSSRRSSIKNYDLSSNKRVIVDELTAKRLEKAANNTLPDGRPANYLHDELNDLYDRFKYGYGSSLSQSQYRRLDDFFDLIYHKFYNYELSIKIQ